VFLLGLIGFFAVGVTLGVLGGGGSILAVPLLVHVMGLPAGVAVPTSLPVVGGAAAVGAAARWRSGQLRLSVVALFALTTMLAAYLAADWGAAIGDRTRLGMLVAVMLIAAAVMWRRAQAPGPETLREQPRRLPRRRVLLVAGALVGALTGIVGVGGGFLIVPVLAGVLGLAMPEATATSLAVIALNAAAASLGWLGEVTLDLGLTAAITATALAGMFAGTAIAPRFSSRALSRAFAGLLGVVAVVMIILEL
jgi:uncharacterized membrane protein YfcA